MSKEHTLTEEEIYQFELFLKAKEMAQNVHAGKYRKSGETYFAHLERVTKILVSWGIRDMDTLCAAWLHDSVEDADVKLKDIETSFNPKIARLVDTVTKFRGSLDAFKDLFRTHQKIAVGATIDVGAALIKLADRLDNMDTVGVFSRKKRHRIAAETLDIYCVLADGLGMWKVRRELQDLAFKHLNPRIYAKNLRLLKKDPRIAEDFIDRQKDFLSQTLQESGITVPISERVKGIRAIYEKHARLCLLGAAEPKSLSKIQDIVSLGIICNTEKECNDAVRIITQKLGDRHLSRYYLDQIARPAENGYRAIKTAYLSSGNNPQLIEIAFMTPEMLDYNLNGIINRPDIKTMQLIPVFTPQGDLEIVPQHFSVINYLLRSDRQLVFRNPTCLVNGKKAEFTQVLQPGDVIEFFPTRNYDGNISSRIRKAAETVGDPTQIQELLIVQENNKSRNTGRKIVLKITTKIGIVELADLGENVVREILSKFEIGDTRPNSLDQLYERVGGPFFTPQEVRQKIIDSISLTDEKRFATLVITGDHDHPGILHQLSGQTETANCNIIAHHQTVGTGYYIRLLITGTRENFGALRELLNEKPSIHSSVEFFGLN